MGLPLQLPSLLFLVFLHFFFFAEWMLLPLPLCSPTFLKPWIKLCVCGPSRVPVKEWKQDTASTHSSQWTRKTQMPSHSRCLKLRLPLESWIKLFWKLAKVLFCSRIMKIWCYIKGTGISKCAFENDPRKTPNIFSIPRLAGHQAGLGAVGAPALLSSPAWLWWFFSVFLSMSNNFFMWDLRVTIFPIQR